MCYNTKLLQKSGIYKKSNYNGEKGTPYEINTYRKCGHCAQCIADKANNWVVRNYYESKGHQQMAFITLTYKENTFFLIKRHLQLFIKNFRRQLQYRYKKKCRIFAAGEYGSISKRPHFHIIIYGWEDKKATYKGLSKKGYPIFESEIVKKCWGKGITTYQIFKDKEIAYIALYNTPQEEMTKTYKSTIENAKKLIEKLNKKEIINIHRKDLIKTINEEIKKAKAQKQKYIEIKEFNTWSKAMGWEQFYEEYKNEETHDFKVYIKDCEFLVPTPWVKKLANNGDKSACAEMLRRKAQGESELEKGNQNTKKLLDIKSNIFNDIEKWTENKKKIDL